MGQEYQNKYYILNIDDVCLVNSLGVRATKHKFTMAYFTIGDIPPEYRSKLSAIFLVTVAKADFVKRYGLHDVLGDFVRGLDKLNTMGIRVPNLGLVKGRLLFTMNDNPTAALLSDMKQSASFSHNVCRTCEINKDLINTKIMLEGLPNRCPE